MKFAFVLRAAPKKKRRRNWHFGSVSVMCDKLENQALYANANNQQPTTNSQKPPPGNA